MTTAKQIELPGGGRAFYRSSVDLELLLREFATNEHAYLRHGVELRNGACVFDVGANIGFFLLSLRRVMSCGSIYAFEPVPQIFELLERNAASLHPFDVKLFPCGLAAKSGDATFSYFPRTSVLSTMRPDQSPEFARNGRRYVLEAIRGRHRALAALVACVPEGLWYPLTESIRRYFHAVDHVSCRLRTLSSIIDEWRIERIDLLKVDTEGAEEDVFAGLRPEHWPRIGQIVVEVHDGPEGVVRMEAFLRARGFTTVSERVFAYADRPSVVFAVRPPPISRAGSLSNPPVAAVPAVGGSQTGR